MREKSVQRITKLIKGITEEITHVKETNKRCCICGGPIAHIAEQTP